MRSGRCGTSRSNARLRRELRDLEDYHRELSRQQPDLTFVIDRKGRIAYASSSIEEALGYRVDTVLGTPFTALIDPAQATDAERWLRAASGRTAPADGGGRGFQLRVVHGDGKVRVLACRPRDCFAIPRIAGMVIHAHGVADDDVIEPVGPPIDVDGAGLRDALLALGRSTHSSRDERIASIVESVRSQLDVSAAMFRFAAGVDGDSPPRIASNGDADASGLRQLGSLGFGTSDEPLVVDDLSATTRPATIDPVALAEAGVAALVDVPVVRDGLVRGRLLVASAFARRWTDAQIDFVVGASLLLALAVDAPLTAAGDAATGATVEAGRNALTGLPDRREAERVLAERVSVASHGEPLVAIVVGLDRLREVNDEHGMAAGDATIVRASEVLVGVAGEVHFVAHLGSDEFLVLAGGLDTRDIEMLMRSMLAGMADPDGAANEAPIAASIGAARYAFDDTDAAGLLLQADLAMREAKQRGGAQAFVFNAKLDAARRTRKELESEIEEALRQGELTIFFQPQIALATGAIVGLEALLRWQHPTRGLLLPEAFIGSAIRLGLIEAVTKYVLLQVCEQIAAWRRAGTLPELPVAVNVSGRQLHDRRLPALIASALLKTGLPARLLVLEITEQSLVGDDATVERVVKELSRLGVRIAIGDFNLGHASFRYLRQLRVSQIKLDSGFVRGLPDDAESAIVVAAFVELADRLVYEVIAEGVETREQFEYLRGVGCEIGQGFFLGAPMSATEVESYIESNRRSPIH